MQTIQFTFTLLFCIAITNTCGHGLYRDSKISSEQNRMWSFANGNTLFEGSYRGSNQGKIKILLTSGRLITIDKMKLSQTDRWWRSKQRTNLKQQNDTSAKTFYGNVNELLESENNDAAKRMANH